MRGVVLVLVEELKKQNETLLPWLLLRHVLFFFLNALSKVKLHPNFCLPVNKL